MTYTLIAHLIDRVIATDLSAAAVTAYLSARADTTRYSVLGANGSLTNGSVWMQQVATSVAA